MRFIDQVAIVTGAACGIGRACAERLAADGAMVVLIDIDEPSGTAAAGALNDRGLHARFLCCDVGQKVEIDATLADVLRTEGKVDILVNNAGVNCPADFLEMTEDDFNRVLRTNLTSAFLFSQAVARSMIERDVRGSIVNMASGNAVMTGPRLAAYAASKGGLVSLTKVMALALAPHSIRVNAVSPGTILTEMTRGRLWDNRAARDQILSRTPLRRFGTVEEVAALVAFLVSSDSSFLTAQTVTLDGGRNALNYTVPIDEP